MKKMLMSISGKGDRQQRMECIYPLAQWSDNNSAIQEFPSEDALSNGVRPSLSLASTFAPRLSSRRTIVPSNLRRDDAARCSSDNWFASLALTSDPCRISISTDYALPLDDARCKGVERVSSRAVTSTPCRINSCTVSAFSPDADQCLSAVSPSFPLTSGLTA